MASMINHREVESVYKSYPQKIQKKLMRLRRILLEVAEKNQEISPVEETLKWGEPSYVTQTGSTVRLAWTASRPKHYFIFFNCKTKLIPTFRELFRDQLKFEGNRAIVFTQEEKISSKEIKHCFLLAMTYHHRKKLPMLGV